MLLTASIAALAQEVNTTANGSADGDAAAPHGSQWKRSIESDLVSEKFDDLDSMANRYREEKLRLSGGEWRLRLFYAALDPPHQTDREVSDQLTHLNHWVQQRPQSITARVALAAGIVRWAMVLHHGFNAATAPMGLFDERIKKAQTVLEEAANIGSMCPQWYSEMMTVGAIELRPGNVPKADAAARMKDLFDRGVQLEPGYFYLYIQYAKFLLIPLPEPGPSLPMSWSYAEPRGSGGSPGAGEPDCCYSEYLQRLRKAAAFAKSSADRLGGDGGDLLYFQIAAAHINCAHQMDWSRIQRGYKALRARYGISHRTMNELALMAYTLRDATVARQQFALIGDNWSSDVWGNRKLFRRARKWCSAGSS
ncbi:MAG: hypothetical protein WA555_06620 [Candidatus Sulfotelmatobacter sp.]